MSNRNTTVTREQLAAEIAEAVNASPSLADEATARAWAKGGHIRVYLSRNHGGRKGFVDAGYLAIANDGTVDETQVNAFEFRYVKADLRAALDIGVAGRTAEAVTATTKTAAARRATDEDLIQYEENQAAIYNSESSREQG